MHKCSVERQTLHTFNKRPVVNKRDGKTSLEVSRLVDTTQHINSNMYRTVPVLPKEYCHQNSNYVTKYTQEYKLVPISGGC